MCRRGQTVITLLVLCAVAAGCGSRESPHREPAKQPSQTLTAEQEAAAREYVVVLDKHITLIEQAVAALASVKADRASQDKARAKIAGLTLEMDLTSKHVRERQPKDPAVLEAAQRRVMERLSSASQAMQAQVSRITKQVEGGQEFFDKDLRQTLSALKGSQ